MQKNEQNNFSVNNFKTFSQMEVSIKFAFAIDASFFFCRYPLFVFFCVRADAGRCCSSDGENGNCVKMRHYKKESMAGTRDKGADEFKADVEILDADVEVIKASNSGQGMIAVFFYLPRVHLPQFCVNYCQRMMLKVTDVFILLSE